MIQPESKPRSREAGQSAVLIALSLFTMVVFMAMATNMGSLVNERIRIQNAADLASYAGAHVQAKKMNDIAYINSKIELVATYCRQRLTESTRIISEIPGDKKKVWNQCLPESPTESDILAVPMPVDGAGDEMSMILPPGSFQPPSHSLNPPPNSDTPSDYRPGIPNPVTFPTPIYGASDECNNVGDSRADDLINWCERTIQYYAQLVYDLNDYGGAYYGMPTTRFSSIFALRRKAIVPAMTNTVQNNYPKPLRVGMLDAPSNSPVSPDRFVQPGVKVSDYVSDVSGYNRPDGGAAMMPMQRYTMYFNYVYFCCGKDKGGPCIEKCKQYGPGPDVTIPMVGPRYDGKMYREFDVAYSRTTSGSNRGIIYMPVRAYGNPKAHEVPLLDNASKAPDSNYFGGWGAWNDLRATAVAKPFEGWIGPDPDLYDAYDVQVAEQLPGPLASHSPTGVFVSQGLEDMLADGEVPYDTFRSRVAGFREPLDYSRYSSSMLAVLVNHMIMDPVRPSDVSPGDYNHTSH